MWRTGEVKEREGGHHERETTGQLVTRRSDRARPAIRGGVYTGDKLDLGSDPQRGHQIPEPEKRL